MNHELEQEMQNIDIIADNFMSIKRRDYEELVRKLHEAEKCIIMHGKSDLQKMAELKPKRIILEL